MKRENVPLTMKINELSEYSGLSSSTIRQMCKVGDLEFIKVGRVYYVVVASLMRLIQSKETL